MPIPFRTRKNWRHRKKENENTPYRLYSIHATDKNIRTELIPLVGNCDNLNNNYFTLLIGNNGVGKSRLLYSIANHYYYTSNSDKIDNSDKIEFKDHGISPSFTIVVSNNLSDRFPYTTTAWSTISEDFIEISHYLYLGIKNENGVLSRPDIMKRAVFLILRYGISKEASESMSRIFHLLSYKPRIVIQFNIKKSTYRLLRQDNDIHAIFPKIPESYEHTQLLKIVYSLSLNNNEIVIDFSDKGFEVHLYNDNNHQEELKTEHFALFELLTLLNLENNLSNFSVKLEKTSGSAISLGLASSGESNLLLSLISMVPLLRDNCLVLIDEPETSLHPSWQSKYIELLNSLFHPYHGCHIIIASHSPFITSDMTPEKSTVTILSNKNGVINGRMLNYSPYAWSTENILLEVFKMPSTRNYYFAMTLQRALELLSDPNHSRQEYQELVNKISEVFPNLKDIDPLKKVAQIIVEHED